MESESASVAQERAARREARSRLPVRAASARPAATAATSSKAHPPPPFSCDGRLQYLCKGNELAVRGCEPMTQRGARDAAVESGGWGGASDSDTAVSQCAQGSLGGIPPCGRRLVLDPGASAAGAPAHYAPAAAAQLRPPAAAAAAEPAVRPGLPPAERVACAVRQAVAAEMRWDHCPLLPRPGRDLGNLGCCEKNRGTKGRRCDALLATQQAGGSCDLRGGIPGRGGGPARLIQRLR